jgi:atrial natriuretic peptide receptor A
MHFSCREFETVNIVDNLIKRLTQYADNLEELVKQRTNAYLDEKRKVEELLHQLLPPLVSDISAEIHNR